MTKLTALILALGFAFGGLFVSRGIVNSRTADRFVTVKGISERDVRADVALWPLRFTSAADNLAQAQKTIEKNKAAIMAFFKKYGMNPDQVEIQGLEVNDALANPYHSGPVHNRFVINQTIMARTDDPEQIRKASQNVSELVDAGVVLSSSGHPGSGPTFLFTKLTGLKPDMIAEATANARNAATQFANDSGSRLGGIRHANQGLFVILPRDPAPGIMESNQINKTVRVVTTVEYFLEDD